MNDEFRMTNGELMTKHKAQSLGVHALSHDYFVTRISGFLRHPSFVLRHFR
jgi:hypothetical protein